jgi:DeoR/GlpR family transcriptional regulator of sugar metabolism
VLVLRRLVCVSVGFSYIGVRMSSSAPSNASSEASPVELPLLRRQRRDAILSLIDTHGAVRVRELTDRFGVSEMTIRRDIDSLASVNLLVRVHGGATRMEQAALSVDEPGFAVKSKRSLPEKRAIAARAASRIRPGSAIGITAGTTTYHMLARLADIAELTVVTNSLAIAGALSTSTPTDRQVVLTGGSPTPSNAIVGPIAERCLAGLHLDQLFMGVHGFDATGFTTPNLAEAQTNLAFITAAREVCVLADASKWGLVGLGTIAPLGAADIVISDEGLAPEAIEAFVKADVATDLVTI